MQPDEIWPGHRGKTASQTHMDGLCSFTLKTPVKVCIQGPSRPPFLKRQRHPQGTTCPNSRDTSQSSLTKTTPRSPRASPVCSRTQSATVLRAQTRTRKGSPGTPPTRRAGYPVPFSTPRLPTHTDACHVLIHLLENSGGSQQVLTPVPFL